MIKYAIDIDKIICWLGACVHCHRPYINPPSTHMNMVDFENILRRKKNNFFLKNLKETSLAVSYESPVGIFNHMAVRINGHVKSDSLSKPFIDWLHTFDWTHTWMWENSQIQCIRVCVYMYIYIWYEVYVYIYGMRCPNIESFYFHFLWAICWDTISILKNKKTKVR